MTPAQEERLVAALEQIAKNGKKNSLELIEVSLMRMADAADLQALTSYSISIEGPTDIQNKVDQKVIALADSMSEEDDDEEEGEGDGEEDDESDDESDDDDDE